ncbi:MAG: hypothetical protein MRJ65_10700 [Candidatus Brocadiaceae bacterium]|nr:hypothetical protein [Candidatus Brocadiaceae bacterium]
MYEIITTRHFMRSARKFLRKHPDQKDRLAKFIDRLKDDPLQPHLELHALGAKLEGVFAASISRNDIF